MAPLEVRFLELAVLEGALTRERADEARRLQEAMAIRPSVLSERIL